MLSLPLQLQQQRAAVDAELQARQAAADDVLQQFDKDIAEPVDKVRDSSNILLVSSLLHYHAQAAGEAACKLHDCHSVTPAVSGMLAAAVAGCTV